MPLKKLALKAGIDRENTSYTSEGGWYDCDKIRFRSGYPEKIGGWRRISDNTFLGVCRSLHKWTSLGAKRLVGVGTSEKFYIELGQAYYDITPIRATEILTNPFAVTSGSNIVTVTDANNGYVDGDYVTFSSATTVGGLDLNGEHKLTFMAGNTYTITASQNATTTTTGGGTVTAQYQINVGEDFAIPLDGWSAGQWSFGTWGVGVSSTKSLRLWSQSNFGQDLIFGHPKGEIYYWEYATGTGVRAVKLDTLSGASNVPVVQNHLLVSDISRFVFCFGCNSIVDTALDPMLVRWSDQEDPTNWTPEAINQAGSLRLSGGTNIITAKQSRQEILVWTDTTLYSLQYVGAPIVWGAQSVGENISIVSKNAVVYANGMAFWMGYDKFYMYDGRSQTLPCSVRKYIFDDLDYTQYDQIFSGSNERFGEVWRWYCSQGSKIVDKYVVFNYLENVWYYGTMNRTAWFDNGISNSPIAATYKNNLVEHELGCDNQETSEVLPISAYVTSAQFDLDDGHQFMFINKVLPDVRFDGSTITNPAITMTMLPLKDSGSGYTDPASVGGVNNEQVIRSTTVPIEKYTGQIHVRVRGRQLAVKIESTGQGVQWQMGSPRIDMRPDGRR